MTFSANINNVKLGTNRATNQPFDGLLDDVRIYDRALSAAEVSDIYNAGGGGTAWPPDCVNDSTVQCVLEATRANDDAQFIPSNIRTGTNILNVTGTLANCANDSSIECILEATRANDDAQFIAANIRGGVNILNVTGSLANCTNDATGECILNATRSTSDAQFIAANVKSGVNILGVTGSYDNRAIDCVNDSTVTCTLEATRVNDDPQFLPTNIRSGVNILNVTGTLANCADNSSIECILEATRANDDPEFLAANIKSGVNILGVTGTFGAAPTSGLVAHWKLDESSGTSAADSSGNGYTGTLTNGPVWQPAGGQIDGALEFDGTNDYVISNTSLAQSGPFTISMFLKADNPSQPEYYAALSSVNAGATTNDFQIDFGGATSGCTGEYRLYRTSTDTLCAGATTSNWAHIAS